MDIDANVMIFSASNSEQMHNSSSENLINSSQRNSKENSFDVTFPQKDNSPDHDPRPQQFVDSIHKAATVMSSRQLFSDSRFDQCKSPTLNQPTKNKSSRNSPMKDSRVPKAMSDNDDVIVIQSMDLAASNSDSQS